mmetsp:Transcript_7133/g.9676  ORF Transcript_7133/g.9676 Transcript_7133/m.9676 type:complete len:87 (+) Transcript_7133:215-475(+)
MDMLDCSEYLVFWFCVLCCFVVLFCLSCFVCSVLFCVLFVLFECNFVLCCDVLYFVCVRIVLFRFILSRSIEFHFFLFWNCLVWIC